MMAGRVEEPVRLPGMISMDLEADNEKLKDLRMNIPLQIFVDTASEPGKGRGRVSPNTKGSHGRSESAEARQRQRTRDWLEGKLGGRPSSTRIRSASAGRDKRTEMAARYWAVLFENLRRAVDDLYRTCECDESCIAAKEVVLVLENYTKEFTDLINWLKLKTEYENTPQPKRPTSLAWDIRKTSPLGRGTPASTPGKLTPTRHLLLTSPAKRQLNFDSNDHKESTTTSCRSRTVSETIKEVGPGLEAEYSPHTSTCSLTKEDGNVSEHEKSDSEQEKDSTPATKVVVEIVDEVVKAANNEAENNLQSKVKESKKVEKKSPEVIKCTPEKKSKKMHETNTAGQAKNKNVAADKTGKVDKAVSKICTEKMKIGSTAPISTCLATAPRPEKAKTTAHTSSAKVTAQNVSSNPAKSTQQSTSTTTKTTVSTSTTTSKTTVHSSSSTATKTSVQVTSSTPTAKPITTFASTVKTSLHLHPKPTPVTTTPLTRTHPRLTRSVTTIGATTNTRGKTPARKTAAGLLITASPRPVVASRPLPPTKASSRPQTVPSAIAPISGSPKQQRISLVARQAKFAIQNQNPNRRTALVPAGKTRPNNLQASGTPQDASCTPPRHHGSATSLSSGSSAKSWADCVRGARSQGQSVSQGLHCSAEDLGGKKGRRKEEDSEGWCTVRRARARVSPGQTGKLVPKGGSKPGYSARNRYRMPSSAMSMPSLALEDVSGEEDGPQSSRPHLEKSSSSASMSCREISGQTHSLAKLGEERGADSEESLSDVLDQKKKKDEFNHSKQKALKSCSVEGEDDNKIRLERAKSFPLSDIHHVEVALVHRASDLATSNDSSVVTEICVEVAGNESHPELPPDVEDEEREKAIAIKELELSHLQREIKETEQAELTDTDCDNDGGTDTDNYTTDTDTNDTRSEVGAVSDITSRYEALLEGLSWAEQCELEDQLGDPSTLEARLPGRAIQLHEKLSSPARKKEPHETFLHYQEKQNRARLRRMRFSEDKAKKLAILNMRIEEAMEQRDKLVDERKDTIETKLRRAEENRIQHIESIRKKAHEEEEKLKEIAFINSLQAQNARMDMITQVETADEKCEERLAEIAGERAKKAEQRRRGAEEAEERRRAMEESRQKQIDLMISRRKEKEERIQEVQAVQREQRKVSAAIKDKERLERLSTVRAAEKDMKEELQEKIQQKQEEAAKRHAEYLEQIQQKAWELSVQKCSSDQGVPVIKPYTVKKKCEACNVLIKSEVHLLSHLRGKQHAEAIGKNLSDEERTEFNLKNIVDAPEGEADLWLVATKERVRVAKRRAKKLKVRMAVKGAEYEQGLAAPNKHTDSPNRARIGKSLREIEKLLASQGKGAWPNNSVSALERAFGEIVRSLDKNSSKDQDVFHALGGFETLGKIYQMLGECKGESTCVIPIKSLVSAGKVMMRACMGHTGNTGFLLLSNKLALITDILLDRLARLTRLEEPHEEVVMVGPDTDPLSASLMCILSSTIQQLADWEGCGDEAINARLQDVVSYIVCSGTVDSLAGYFQLVRDPIDSSPEVAEFLLTSLQMLTSLTAAIESGEAVGEDPTHLLAALQGTELAGTVSMLYGMLLHQGRDSDRSESPTSLPDHTLAVVTETCTLLHRLVRNNARVTLIQAVLGQEGISLEFRHIASYLLYYCQHHSQSDLLAQVIVLVGYFTANHPDNQSIVQSGSQPSVLQQLANLPFQFFSQPELKVVLFPTLLSSCHGNEENTAILGQEMSWKLIEEFVQSEEGRENKLVRLVIEEEQKQ